MTTNVLDEFSTIIRSIENARLECLGNFTAQEFWNFVETRQKPAAGTSESSSPDLLQSSLEEAFIAYFDKKNFLFPALTMFLKHELQNSKRDTLFRTKSIPLSILSTVWYRREGKPLLEKLKEPLRRIALSKESLEINPSKSSSTLQVKKNIQVLLDVASSLLDVTFDESSYSENIRFVFQAIDKIASVKFESNYSIVGGVLFLRLINPAIMFPEKHGLIPADQITSHGREALVYVGKILQTLANNSEFNNEPYLSPANRFVRRNQARWLAFFHRMFTGKDLVNADSVVLDNIKPEDLIAKSNHDIYRQLVCPMHLGKQKELTLHLFQLEKQTDGWKYEVHPNFSLYWKKIPNSSQYMWKYVVQVPATVEEAYNFMKEFCSREPESLDAPSHIKQKRVVERFNDNLEVFHMKYAGGSFLTDRDFVFLRYSEVLPEEDFAMAGVISIQRDDVPEERGVVRGELEGGCIIRAGTKKGTAQLSKISHVDFKGWSKMLPSSFFKKQLKGMVEKDCATICRHFGLL